MRISTKNNLGKKGEMIDNIEYNLNNTNEYVEEGRVQTKEAIEYKKKATKVILHCFSLHFLVIL